MGAVNGGWWQVEQSSFNPWCRGDRSQTGSGRGETAGVRRSVDVCQPDGRAAASRCNGATGQRRHREHEVSARHVREHRSRQVEPKHSHTHTVQQTHPDGGTGTRGGNEGRRVRSRRRAQPNRIGDLTLPATWIGDLALTAAWLGDLTLPADWMGDLTPRLEFPILFLVPENI